MLGKPKYKEGTTVKFTFRNELKTDVIWIVDKQANENAILRLDVEKYKRAYLTTAKRCVALERELKELKDKIKNLVK